MRGEYTLLLTGLVIFLTATLKYHSPQSIQVQSFCDPNKRVCAHCPVKKAEGQKYIGSSIRHNSSFKVLYCDSKFMFILKSCAEYLELVDSNMQLEKISQVYQNQFQNEIYYEMGQKYPIFSTLNYYFLKHNEDFIIFTKQNGSQKPNIDKESIKNEESLYFFAKIINQSALIALLISTVMSCIGFSCFSYQSNRIPALQILILIASFIISKNQLFFQYFQQIKAVSLLIISTKMVNQYRFFKLISIVWLLTCFLQQKFVIIGYCYLFCQFRKRNKMQFKLIMSILFLVFISLQVLSIVPLSFISYISTLWQAIFIPILLLTFQGESILGVNDSFQ